MDTGVLDAWVRECSQRFGESINQPKKERGVKHDFSKPQMSLLPLKDLEGVVRVLEFGMKKYARGDWKFVPDGGMRYFDAGMRHLAELSDPTDIEDLARLDQESVLPHIDHAICSLIFARHFIFKDMEEKYNGKQTVPVPVSAGATERDGKGMGPGLKHNPESNTRCGCGCDHPEDEGGR